MNASPATTVTMPSPEALELLAELMSVSMDIRDLIAAETAAEQTEGERLIAELERAGFIQIVGRELHASLAVVERGLDGVLS
jgi:hypothetical protein